MFVGNFIFKRIRRSFCLRAVKWFQVLLSNINNSIYEVFQLNSILIICLHTVKWFHILLFNTNNSIN